MTTAERYRAILSNHLPSEAVGWVYDYLDRHKVHFHITLRRQSKLGDYRWPQPRHPFHEISVNGDLTPCHFLWVLLHEAAHLETHLRYDRAGCAGVAAHGHEWQAEYACLLRDHLEWFPPEARPLIEAYVSRIPLRKSLGVSIEEALQRVGGTGAATPLRLDDLPVGSRFRLAGKRQLVFVSLERRRTRWLCREAGSGRQYLVNGRAEVEVVE